MSNTNPIKKYYHSVFFLFSVIFISTLTEYIIFIYNIGGYGPNPIATLAKCVGDLAIILYIFWLLPSKKRWIILIVQFLLSIFFITNIWYYRSFREILSPLSYRLISNLNSTLFSSLLNILHFEDIIFIIFPIFLIIFLLHFNKINKNSSTKNNLNKRTRLIAFISSILLWITGQSAHIITERKQEYGMYGFIEESVYNNIKRRLSFNINDMPFPTSKLRHEGLTLYFVRSLVMILHDIRSHGGHIKLNKENIETIDRYISRINIESISVKDSIISHKNVILILVESLNSYVIDKSFNGNYLTPTMNGLIHNDRTVSALNMRTQVKNGVSSDGQLIINTGLLPIKDGVVMLNYGRSNNFPSLIDALPNHDNLAIFGDDGTTWNQTENFKKFGFNRIYSELNFKREAEKIGNDGAMFKQCCKLIPSLKIPFFIELVTFSTHLPFKDEAVKTPSWIKALSNTEEHVKNYYSMINYFDRELGNFIQFLKDKNLWDETLLIITSDHSILVALSQEDQKIYKRLSEVPSVFIAANSGITKQIDHPVGQVNIFPTILQLMNSSGINGYRGLGKSLLDDNLTSTVDSDGEIWGEADSIEIAHQRQAFEISELIHKGNYFKNTKIHTKRD